MKAKLERQQGLEGLPEYIPGLPIEEVKRRYGLRDVIKLASNENPLGASPLALAAIVEGMTGLNYYPDGPSQDLREALAARNSIHRDQVIMGNGADGLIQMTCQAYLNPGDEVITSCSSFPLYDIYTQVMRGRIIKTAVRDFGFDLEAIATAITSRTKIIFICNPNNPTGTLITNPGFDQFLAQVPPEVLVVSDEAYFEFVDRPGYPDTLALVRAGMPNLLILRTFSKCYGLAGIRLGYAFGSQQALNPLWQVKEPFTVNLLAQKAGLAALKDEDFLRLTVGSNRASRDYFCGELDELGLGYVPSQTNFVLVHLGPHAGEIIHALLMQGIIVRPGSGYDLPEHVRVSLGTLDQMKRLVTALSALRGQM
jgi:histidinol-phosphate aminotransferase